jgi:hypothetical protein
VGAGAEDKTHNLKFVIEAKNPDALYVALLEINGIISDPEIFKMKLEVRQEVSSIVRSIEQSFHHFLRFVIIFVEAELTFCLIFKEGVFVFMDNINLFIGAQNTPGPDGSVIQDFTTRVRPDRVHEVVVDGRKGWDFVLTMQINNVHLLSDSSQLSRGVLKRSR